MYTVGSWLMPRAADKKLMEIMQPVASKRSEVWTDSIEECFQWFLSGENRMIFDMEAAKEKTLLERDAKKSPRKG